MQYFYTDPLAAAWMENHQEMSFVDERGREITIVDGTFIADAFSDGQACEKAYLNPRSLQLLKPRVDDIVIEGSEYFAKITGFIDGKICALFGDELDYVYDPAIIQRNGLAFMWPESEKVGTSIAAIEKKSEPATKEGSPE